MSSSCSSRCTFFSDGYKALSSSIVLSYHWEKKNGWETHSEPNLPQNVWFESMFHSHLAVTTGNKSLWQREDNMIDKKKEVTLEIQLLMDSLSRSKVPVWSETGTRRPLSLKAISVLFLFYGRVRSFNTFQPKNDWVLKNTAMFFVKFTGDAYRWITMQVKVEHSAEELIIAKRIPCQSTKTFHKSKRSSTNLQAQSHKPDTSTKLRKSE